MEIELYIGFISFFLTALVLVVVFSVLANFILETNSLKNEAFKQKYLYLQAKNHILFLEDYILKTNLEDTKDINSIKDIIKDFIIDPIVWGYLCQNY